MYQKFSSLVFLSCELSWSTQSFASVLTGCFIGLVFSKHYLSKDIGFAIYYVFCFVELDGRLQFTGFFTDEDVHERQILVKFLNTLFELFYVKIFWLMVGLQWK